jgi:hypothetical protein
MPDHACPHTKTVARIEKILDGNGQTGLVRTVTELNVKVEDMEDVLSKVATSLSGINQSREAEVAIQRDREKRARKRERAWTIAGILFGILFGGSAIIQLIANIAS